MTNIELFSSLDIDKFGFDLARLQRLMPARIALQSMAGGRSICGQGFRHSVVPVDNHQPLLVI